MCKTFLLGQAIKLFVILAITSGTTVAHANVTFDWATVGNAGNQNDPRFTNGIGGVTYEYRISKTDVTNSQYVEFLNAVDPTGGNTLDLYKSNMATQSAGGVQYLSGNAIGSKYQVRAGRNENPVVYVSWLSSARFMNWLHNGQGSGDTEDGAYTLQGGTAIPSNTSEIIRNPGATYFLPTRNEWHKAAYHDSSQGTAGVYYNYANSSNDIPVSDQPGDDPGAMNFYRDDGIANGFNDGYAVSGLTISPLTTNTNPFTDVGAYFDAISPYGTFDQNGNASEWSEQINWQGNANDSWALYLGGAYDTQADSLRSFGEARLWGTGPGLGFRVATVVPEPASLSVLGIFSLLVLRRNIGNR